MRKREKSLKFQFFIIIFAMLMVANFVSLFMIKNIFPQYEEQWKRKNIRKDVGEIIHDIETEEYSYLNFKENKYKFYSQYDVVLDIQYKDGGDYERELWYTQKWWTIHLSLEDGREVKFIIDETSNWGRNSWGNLEEGKKIFVVGILNEKGYLENYSYFMDKPEMVHVGDEKLKSLGTIKEIVPCNEEEMKEFVLSREYYSTLNYKNGDELYIMNGNEWEIKDYKGRELNITVRSPFYRTDVMLRGLSEFYIRFFIMNAVIALVLAFICSRILQKPILRVSGIAKKMMNLDFTREMEKSNIKEFNSIEESLNLLSKNLHEALDKLQKELDEKNKQEEIRKEFVANVSHELKTPLSVIRCYTDMIHDGIEEHRNEEQYRVIVDEIGKMNRLIMQMLELSRVQSGKIQIHKENFNVRGLVEDVKVMMEGPAQKRGITVEIRGEFLQVFADENKIEQVLTNFLSNAVKYSHEGSPIEIRGIKIGDINRIEINNKCRHISQEDADKLWRRFYKRDKSRNQEGTGLGLAIVGAVLQNHKLHYGVISEDDGLTFYFDLPTLL